MGREGVERVCAQGRHEEDDFREKDGDCQGKSNLELMRVCDPWLHIGKGNVRAPIG